MIKIPKQLYRHHKGGQYYLLCKVFSEDQHEPFAVYVSTSYPVGDSIIWQRPWKEFTEKFQRMGDGVEYAQDIILPVRGTQRFSGRHINESAKPRTAALREPFDYKKQFMQAWVVDDDLSAETLDELREDPANEAGLALPDNISSAPRVGGTKNGTIPKCVCKGADYYVVDGFYRCDNCHRVLLDVRTI